MPVGRFRNESGCGSSTTGEAVNDGRNDARAEALSAELPHKGNSIDDDQMGRELIENWFGVA